MGAAHSRASRRGRRHRRPAKPSANGHPPGNHPRRLPLPPTPAEGSRPLPTDRTIDGCSRHPPGRACPAPTVRRSGNECPRKPRSVSISPSVGRGAPTPPRPPAAANNSPCLPPWGKVAPQGRMRGGLPPPPIPRANRRGRRPRRSAKPCAAAHSRATRRGRCPRRPAKPCADVLPRVTTRGDSRCRQHPRRGQDPSLRTEPVTGVRVTPPGRACPAPTARRPGNGCPRKPHSVSISPSVGRGAPTPPPPPAAANTPGGMNPSTTALAFPLGERWPRRAG